MTISSFSYKSLSIDERNRLKTKNNMGFSHLTPSKVTQELYKQAKTEKGIYADIGAAYGIDTIHMIKAGARVIAIDLERHHLHLLKEQLDSQEQKRIDIRCGRFPEETVLELETYHAILLSRILIFLTPDSLNKALENVYKALKRKGKVYITTLSAFSDKWGSVLSLFKEHKEKYPEEPLFVSNLWEILPRTKFFLPPSIQIFDQDSLRSSLEKKGFQVIEYGYESHYGTVDTYAIAQKI